MDDSCRFKMPQSCSLIVETLVIQNIVPIDNNKELNML